MSPFIRSFFLRHFTEFPLYTCAIHGRKFSLYKTQRFRFFTFSTASSFKASPEKYVVMRIIVNMIRGAKMIVEKLENFSRIWRMYSRCTFPRRVSFLYPSRHLEFQISLSFQDLITNDTSREQTKTQV